MKAAAEGCHQAVSNNPALPPETVEINVPKAIVAYTDGDNDRGIHMLYESASGPCQQITFHIWFDLPLKSAFFKLRVPIELKAFPEPKTPLFLHLDPSRIASLKYECSKEPPPVAHEQLGPAIACLRFRLHQHAGMIVPPTSLTPRKREAGGKLDGLKALAQQTSFNVYFAKDVLEDGPAHDLCALVASLTRIAELDLSNAYSKSEVDDLIEKTTDDNQDLLEAKLEDGTLGAKSDMEDFVERELRNAEERVLQRLSSASWVLDRGSV
ncbi:hypothetical protein ACJZ2D_002041 [Fusarium nematophilum]